MWWWLFRVTYGSLVVSNNEGNASLSRKTKEGIYMGVQLLKCWRFVRNRASGLRQEKKKEKKRKKGKKKEEEEKEKEWHI